MHRQYGYIYHMENDPAGPLPTPTQNMENSICLMFLFLKTSPILQHHFGFHPLFQWNWVSLTKQKKNNYIEDYIYFNLLGTNDSSFTNCFK